MKPSTRGGGPAQERELRAQGRKTMRKLLDAGMTVFERRGYHSARVDDIVKVARTSHGTFYLYFSNKEDLFRALVADVAAEMAELNDSLGPVSPDEAGYNELVRWLDHFVDLYERYGPVIRAWTEADSDDNQIGLIGSDALAAVTRTLADRMTGRSARPGINREIAALAAVAMVERLNYYARSRRIPIERTEMVETLATILHAGLFGGERRAGRPRLTRRA